MSYTKLYGTIFISSCLFSGCAFDAESIEIKFTRHASFITNLNGVSVNGRSLTANESYQVTSGPYIIKYNGEVVIEKSSVSKLSSNDASCFFVLPLCMLDAAAHNSLPMVVTKM